MTAFENSYYPGYVTEKLWDPLRLGTLPIYLGAPNVRLLFPDNSFLNVDDFLTVHDLADHIEFLLENRDEYDKYHLWREKRIPDNLREIWKFNEEPIDCRICRWGAENLFLC